MPKTMINLLKYFPANYRDYSQPDTTVFIDIFDLIKLDQDYSDGQSNELAMSKGFIDNGSYSDEIRDLSINIFDYPQEFLDLESTDSKVLLQAFVEPLEGLFKKIVDSLDAIIWTENETTNPNVYKTCRKFIAQTKTLLSNLFVGIAIQLGNFVDGDLEDFKRIIDSTLGKVMPSDRTTEEGIKEVFDKSKMAMQEAIDSSFPVNYINFNMRANQIDALLDVFDKANEEAASQYREESFLKLASQELGKFIPRDRHQAHNIFSSYGGFLAERLKDSPELIGRALLCCKPILKSLMKSLKTFQRFEDSRLYIVGLDVGSSMRTSQVLAGLDAMADFFNTVIENINEGIDKFQGAISGLLKILCDELELNEVSRVEHATETSLTDLVMGLWRRTVQL